MFLTILQSKKKWDNVIGMQHPAKFFFFFSFLFSVYAQGGSAPITFEELKHPETFEFYNDRDVEIIGFLNRDADRKPVLCPLPNLKTCCINKEGSCRIYLDDQLLTQSGDNPIRLSGTLRMRGNKYFLENIQVLPIAKAPLAMLSALAGIVILSVFGLIRLLKKNTNKN